MLTSSGMNVVSAGAVMGAWIEPVGRGQTQITVVTKRRVATNLATTLSETTFQKRCAQAVTLVKAGQPLPRTAARLTQGRCLCLPEPRGALGPRAQGARRGRACSLPPATVCWGTAGGGGRGRLAGRVSHHPPSPRLHRPLPHTSPHTSSHNTEPRRKQLCTESTHLPPLASCVQTIADLMVGCRIDREGWSPGNI